VLPNPTTSIGEIKQLFPGEMIEFRFQGASQPEGN
jgi:hypothetical protein